MKGFGWLKKIFKRSSKKVHDIVIAPDPVTPGEQALINWHADYYKRKDGYLVVRGNLNVSNKGLTELPDLSNVLVEGNFSCMHNKLTSLQGAPRMFTALMSDFGVFWEGNIPENLRNPSLKPNPPHSGSFSL